MSRHAGKNPGRIRIVAGELRGSRLDVPASAGLRPTPARVRETLFNWLAPIIRDARCLDLFAGSGALGIEALSRGAGRAVFVERERALVEGLRANLDRLHASNVEIACADALAFLAGAAEPFDVVFLDPPFSQALWSPAAQALEERGWLSAQAMIHIESPPDARPALPENWRIHRQGRAGEVGHALYRRLAGIR